MAKNKINERLAGLDLLKCISCIGVIALHVFQIGEGDSNGVAFFSFGYSIPIFFMVNGYLILSKAKIHFAYILRKESALILFAFWWNFAWGLFRFLHKREQLNPFMETFKNLFLQDGYFNVFWFLGALICVYMLAIPLHNILNSKWRSIPLVILFLICCGIDLLSVICIDKTGRALQSFIPQTFRLWTWLFYFYLGGYISKRRSETHISKMWSAILVVVFIFNIIYEYFIGFKRLGITLPEYYYDNIFLMVEVYILFNLFYNFKNERLQRWIYIAASGTAGVFPLHEIVINYSRKIYGYQYTLLNILAIAIIFLVSLSATLIIKSIPLLRRLVIISTTHADHINS